MSTPMRRGEWSHIWTSRILKLRGGRHRVQALHLTILSCSLLHCFMIPFISAQSFAESPPASPNDSTIQSSALPPSSPETQRLELTVKIPATSPYVFGYDPYVLRGRSPDHNEVSSSPSASRSLKVWRELFGRISATISQRAQQANLSAEERETLTRLAELELPSSEEAWYNIGVDPSPRFWVYGLGLTPALTIEMRDVQRFKGWLERSLSGLNLGFKSVEHHRGRYWRKQMKRWVVLARIQGASTSSRSAPSGRGIAHLAIIPSAAEPILLSYFMRDRERDHITDKLIRLSSQLPSEAQASGLIQLSSLIDLFFGSKVPLLMHSGRALGLPSPLFESCAHDLRSIGQATPSLTFGLSSKVVASESGPAPTQIPRRIPGSEPMLESGIYHIYTLAQLAPSPLSYLKRLALNTPKLWHRADPSALEIGLGVSPSALYSLLQGTLEEWRDRPWTCQPLKGFNTLPKRFTSPAISAVMEALKLTRGFVAQATYTSLQGDQQRGEKQRRELSGWIEIAHDHPQQLIQLSSLLASAPLSIPMNASPQNVSLSFPNLAQPLASARDGHLIFSVGEWGASAHKTLSSSENIEGLIDPLPLFWFHSPPQLNKAFKQWYDRALRSNQARSKQAHSIGQGQSVTSRQDAQLRSVRVDLSRDGILIKSTLSIKAL